MTGYPCGKTTNKIFEANQKPGASAGLFIIFLQNISDTHLLLL